MNPSSLPPQPQVRIAISGACGRMGSTVGRLAAADPGFRIAAALERRRHPRLGQDYGAALGREPLGVIVSETLDAPADALIDFSDPAGALDRVAECEARKVPMVIGTTGLGADASLRLDRAAKTIPVLVSSNMSLGMNLLFQIVEEIARKLGRGFDIEIVETHHRHKADAPSGSALSLAEAAARGRGLDPAKAFRHGRHGQVGARAADEIGLHAVRGGDIVGEHVVSFIAEGETVEIAHRARSREIFARGALHAARALRSRQPGRYSFRDLL